MRVHTPERSAPHMPQFRVVFEFPFLLDESSKPVQLLPWVPFALRTVYLCNPIVEAPGISILGAKPSRQKPRILQCPSGCSDFRNRWKRDKTKVRGDKALERPHALGLFDSSLHDLAGVFRDQYRVSQA